MSTKIDLDQCYGTEGLTEAIGDDIIDALIDSFFKMRQFHYSYSNEDTLNMLEGLSNYEIVGDWQRFLTVKPDYIFKLPEQEKRKFAQNFSIGNKDAEECLISLWNNGIETTGTDVMRPSQLDSTNNITICCRANEIFPLMETLRKVNTCQK